MKRTHTPAGVVQFTAGPQCDECREQPVLIRDGAAGFCSARCHERWLNRGDEPDVIPFTLANDRPATRKVEFHNNERRKQFAMFSGLDCQPGQQDLFDEGAVR